MKTAGLELGKRERMRPRIYVRSYSIDFTEGLLYVPGNSGPEIQADQKTGISLACEFDILVTRF